jgi:succinate dehydrogenase/fumarate reductase flavoprotein subunit
MVALLKVGMAVALWGLLGFAYPSAQSVGALVVAGVIVGSAVALGTLRQQLSNSRSNTELANERVQLLEHKNTRLTERNALLEARPNLEQHALLLQKLIERLERHDEMAAARDELTVQLLRGIWTSARGDQPPAM